MLADGILAATYTRGGTDGGTTGRYGARRNLLAHVAAPAAAKYALVGSGAGLPRHRNRLRGDGGHPGDGQGDRDRRVLRRRLPLDAVGSERASRERTWREPHRCARALP